FKHYRCGNYDLAWTYRCFLDDNFLDFTGVTGVWLAPQSPCAIFCHVAEESTTWRRTHWGAVPDWNYVGLAVEAFGDLLKKYRPPITPQGDAALQVCQPRYLIDHRDRRVHVRRPTIAAIATHSIEKLYDPHDMLPHCDGKLCRVQYLDAIRRLEV